jgi:hypothetical protein
MLDWYRLRWPREVTAERLRAMSLLLAATAGAPVVVETAGRAGTVEHRLGLRADRETTVAQLRRVVPGLSLVALDARPTVESVRAIDLRLTTPLRVVRIDEADLVAQTLLTALAHARDKEEVVLQWQLIGSIPPTCVSNVPEGSAASPLSVADVLLGRRGRLDSEGRQALRAKRALPVWRAVGRIGVEASTPARADHLLNAAFAALRPADAPGVRFVGRRGSAKRMGVVGRSWFAPLRLNSAELATVAGWPTGSTAELPVEHSGARRLPASRAIPHTGRVVVTSTASDRARALALSSADGLRHMHVLGPTGTGKSTLLLNLIAQDVAAGRGVVVIEPKGDLIGDVLERIPTDRLADVVVLDPADDHPVGLNPLASRGRSPELLADELLGMFRSSYDSWGPRTNDILGASLLTLARTQGMTLCALPALLTDDRFRHRVVSAIDDPIGLEPFWANYEAWSAAERTAAIAPSLTRIRPLLLRPQLRAVLGQSQPRFELAQVFADRKVLLVSLASGKLGSEAAALLGSLILSQLWSAAQQRTNVPRARRHPVFIYVDEVQDYLRLPTDLGDALVQARGLGVGFVFAHQHLSQLDPATRSAMLANARSRVCFQLSAEDARALASGAVSLGDLRELPAFEVYAQLVAGGAVQPWCSGRTSPATAAFSHADEVRAMSRNRYGVERKTVDVELETLLGGRDFAADDLAPRRRKNGGAT